MTAKDIFGSLGALGKGLLSGFVTIFLIVTVLILMTRCAMADEPTHVHSDAQLETLITALTDYEAAVEYDLAVADPVDCKQSNAYIQFMLDRIHLEVGRHPELAYIYQDTLDYLNTAWCTR